MADVTDLEAAFGYNPNLMRQGQRARVLQEKPSDYQNQHTDVTAFLAGLLGVPPDELSGSVMDPNRQRLKEIAEPAFAASTLAQAIPAIGALAKLARFSGLSGSAGNVGRGLSKQVGAIKPKGGNWLEGSVEGALKGLKRRIRAEGVNGHTAENVATDVAMNNWIEKQLTRYIKNEMATPEDPIRALAERGVLHYDPPEEAYLGNLPKTRGQNAVTPLAKGWEDISDTFVNVAKPRELIDNVNFPESQSWLPKVSPETDVYWISGKYLGGDLGFAHLTGELANALNPESGLPRHLLLDPKSMDRVSVPQAVERVSQINAWRDAQKAEADLARANNAATVLHKDYPEKGFKWVELKAPTAKSVEDLSPEQVTWYNEYLQGGVSPERALQEASKRTQKTLEDALKYEGDTMGHCVGGYCHDVLEGKSRIFSLRDSKGQPHVTIETSPKRNIRSYLETLQDPARPPEGGPLGTKWTLHDRVQRERSGNGDYDVYANKLLQELGLDTPQQIIQIKGKANRAPNPEYLPFVQDFVKSGKWSDVGDLQNTGLKRLSDMGDEPMIKAAREKLGDYATQEEWDALMRGEGYARGGPVRKQVGGPFIGHVAPESNLGHDQVAPGMRKGGLSQIKECCYGR